MNFKVKSNRAFKLIREDLLFPFLLLPLLLLDTINRLMEVEHLRRREGSVNVSFHTSNLKTQLTKCLLTNVGTIRNL